MATGGEMGPLLERTSSVAGTRPIQGSIRPPRLRAQNVQPEPNQYITPSGPPDISCADISQEQFARTYSRSCVWDPQINPVPPIQEMEGFGRFRRSVHADANWELSKFCADLQALGPAAVQHLGDFEIAELKHGVMDHIRTSSYTSLASRSGSESEKTSTGARICRGFTPFKTSLTASSSEGCSDSLGRNKSCTTSLDGNEGTSGQLPPPAKHTSFLRFDNGPAPLATIDESTGKLPKKRTVPLIFDTQGTVDVAIDDDEYESCEESFAPVNVLAKANTKGSSTVAPNRHERKGPLPQVAVPTKHHSARHHRGIDHVLEKVRIGQKKLTKPVTRRLSSHKAKALVKRAASTENVSAAVEIKPPATPKAQIPPANSTPQLGVLSPKAQPTQSDASTTETLPDPGVYMVQPQASKTAAWNESPKFSHRSDSMSGTVKPRIDGNACLSAAQGRNRSGTAIRLHSGNIPIIYVEGNVQQLVPIGEVDRKGLQAVAA